MMNIDTRLNWFITRITFENRNITIYVWSKNKHKYIKTSIVNLPVTSPRVKCFLAHNGSNHHVISYSSQKDMSVALYTTYVKE
jgi:hypothetical protein